MGTAMIVGTGGSGRASHDLDMIDLVLGEAQIVGSFNGSYSLQLAIPRLADLVAAGEIELAPLVSDDRPLDEVYEPLDDLEHGTSRRQVLLPS